MRERRPRILLPNQPVAGSSVEHFYHFLLSYFLPIEAYVRHRHLTEIVLRDCGPLNPWFDLLSTSARITIAPRDEVAGLVESAGEGGRRVVLLKSFERHHDRRRRGLNHIAGRVAQRLASTGQLASEPTTLIERIAPDSFYDTIAENLSAGSQRRSIPNFAELLSHLRQVTSLQVFHGELMSPEQQVACMRETRVLIAQHGAGLTSMVWMRRGGLIVEILPLETGSDLRFLFSDLASELGHSYLAVSQASPHAPVDVESVVTAFQRGNVENRTWG